MWSPLGCPGSSRHSSGAGAALLGPGSARAERSHGHGSAGNGPSASSFRRKYMGQSVTNTVHALKSRLCLEYCNKLPRHSVKAATPGCQQFNCQDSLKEANVLNFNDKKQQHPSATFLGYDLVQEPLYFLNRCAYVHRQKHRLVKKHGGFCLV